MQAVLPWHWPLACRERASLPDTLDVTATVTLDVSSGTPTITSSHLDLKAKIPGITNEKFQELAKGAEKGCPISRVLKAEVSLDASLV